MRGIGGERYICELLLGGMFVLLDNFGAGLLPEKIDFMLKR